MEKHNRLIYLPLGGAGEIGMNMYAYGYGPEESERFILIDAGVMFPDMETTPGVDRILPDISWVRDHSTRIEGLFLTHAHEDHIGAVPHLLERMHIPVFARRFTSELVKAKVAEFGIDAERINTVGELPEKVAAGPFSVGFCLYRTQFRYPLPC